MYKGLDIIYSEDDRGYYACDFNQKSQPVSKIYRTLKAIKKAIDDNKIKLK